MLKYVIIVLALTVSLAYAKREIVDISEAAEIAAEKLGKHLLSYRGLGSNFVDGEVYTLHLQVHSPLTDQIDWVTVIVSLTEDQFSLEGVSGNPPEYLEGQVLRSVPCTGESSSFEVIGAEIARRLNSSFVLSYFGLDECLRTSNDTDIHFTQHEIQLQTLTTNETNWYWAVTYAEHDGANITNMTIETLQQFRWPGNLAPEEYKKMKDSDYTNMTEAADFIAGRLGKHLITYDGYGISNILNDAIYHLTLLLHSPITNSTDWVTATASFNNGSFSLDGLASSVPSEIVSFEKDADCSELGALYDETSQRIAENFNSEFITTDTGYDICNNSTGVVTSQRQIQLHSLASNITSWSFVTTRVEHDGGEIINLAIENVVSFREPSEL